MSNEFETRSQRRRMILMVMAAAFLIWQVPAMDFFANVANESGRLKALLSGAGFLFWVGGLVVLLGTGRTATQSDDPAVTSALEDELVRANRAKSFIVGYAAALTSAGIVFAMSLILPVSGVDAAHIILVVSVVAPMFAFVFLERPSA